MNSSVSKLVEFKSKTLKKWKKKRNKQKKLGSRAEQSVEHFVDIFIVDVKRE